MAVVVGEGRVGNLLEHQFINSFNLSFDVVIYKSILC